MFNNKSKQQDSHKDDTHQVEGWAFLPEPVPGKADTNEWRMKEIKMGTAHCVVCGMEKAGRSLTRAMQGIRFIADTLGFPVPDELTAQVRAEIRDIKTGKVMSVLAHRTANMDDLMATLKDRIPEGSFALTGDELMHMMSFMDKCDTEPTDDECDAELARYRKANERQAAAAYN